MSGKYSFGEKNFLPFNLGYSYANKNSKIRVLADFDKEVEIFQINYKKQKGNISNISIDMNKSKNNLNINESKITPKERTQYLLKD